MQKSSEKRSHNDDALVPVERPLLMMIARTATTIIAPEPLVVLLAPPVYTVYY